jgi:hypothetical protein
LYDGWARQRAFYGLVIVLGRHTISPPGLGANRRQSILLIHIVWLALHAYVHIGLPQKIIHIELLHNSRQQLKTTLKQNHYDNRI